jgi:integrase
VKLPRPDPEPIIPLTIHEVKLIDSALNNYHDIRDYCMLHLMLDCGLRRQEVINLKQNDCFFGGKNKYIIIRNSKYNKSRMVPVPDFLVREISGLYHPCNFYSLFHSLDFRSNCITIDVVKKLFRNLKKESGVMRLHPHLLRHTFATSFIAGGGNMEYLRLYLGHSDYSIVQNYLHISLQTQICGHDIYRLDKVFFKNYNMQDN